MTSKAYRSSSLYTTPNTFFRVTNYTPQADNGSNSNKVESSSIKESDKRIPKNIKEINQKMLLNKVQPIITNFISNIENKAQIPKKDFKTTGSLATFQKSSPKNQNDTSSWLKKSHSNTGIPNLKSDQADFHKFMTPNVLGDTNISRKSLNTSPSKLNFRRNKILRDIGLNNEKPGPICEEDTKTNIQDPLEMKIIGKFKLEMDKKRQFRLPFFVNDFSNKGEMNAKKDKGFIGLMSSNSSPFNFNLYEASPRLTYLNLPNNSLDNMNNNNGLNSERLQINSSFQTNEFLNTLGVENNPTTARGDQCTTSLTSRREVNSPRDISIPHFSKEIGDILLSVPGFSQNYINEFTCLSRKISTPGNPCYNTPISSHMPELPKILEDINLRKSNEMKISNSQPKRIQDFDLGNIKKDNVGNLFSAPARMEIRKMSQWIDETIQNILNDNNINESLKCLKCDEVLNISLNEIIKQVSIECAERGTILIKIWSLYLKLFGKIKDQLVLQRDKKVIELESDYSKFRNLHKETLDKKQMEISKLNEALQDTILGLKKTQEENIALITKNNMISRRLEEIKNSWEHLRYDNEKLQSENEYLKLKLKNQSEQRNNHKEESLQNNGDMNNTSQNNPKNEAYNRVNAAKIPINKGREVENSHHKKVNNCGALDFNKLASASNRKKVKSCINMINLKSESKLSFSDDDEDDNDDTSSEDNLLDKSQLVSDIKHINNMLTYRKEELLDPNKKKFTESNNKFSVINEEYLNDYKSSIMTQTDLQLVDTKYDKLLCEMKKIDMALTDVVLRENLNIIDAIRNMINGSNVDTMIKSLDDISDEAISKLIIDTIDMRIIPKDKMNIIPHAYIMSNKRNTENSTTTNKIIAFHRSNTLYDSGDAELKSIIVKDNKKSHNDETINSLGVIDDVLNSVVSTSQEFFNIQRIKSSETLKSLASDRIIDQEESRYETIKEAEDENINEEQLVKTQVNDIKTTHKNLAEPNLKDQIGYKVQIEAFKKKICQFTESNTRELIMNEEMKNIGINNFIKLNDTIDKEKAKMIKLIVLIAFELEKNKNIMQSLDILQESLLEEQAKNIKSSEEIVDLKNRIAIMNEKLKKKGKCLHKKCPICLDESKKKLPNDSKKDESLNDLGRDTENNIDEDIEKETQSALKRRSFKKKVKRLSCIRSSIISIKKSNIFEKRANNGPRLVEKLKTKPLSKFMNFMPIKLVLKQITNIYEERLAQSKENAVISELDLSTFVMHSFMNNYGFKKIAEQKFIIFVLSLKRYLHIVRINLFSRFLGLFDANLNFSNDEFNQYIEALDYINNSRMAFPITNNESDSKHYLAFLRLLDYIKAFSEGKMGLEEYTEFKREFESLKENDPKNINRYGIIDFDLSMTKILMKYRSICIRIKQIIITVFKAIDLFGNKTCNLNDFLLIYKHIEPEKYSPTFCETIFTKYAHKYHNTENNLTFDKFTILCMEYQLFNDQQQNKFIGIANQEDILNKYNEVKLKWIDIASEFKNKLINLKNCPEENKHYWLNMLNHLENRINDQILDLQDMKSILIAYKIFESELKSLQQSESESEKAINQIDQAQYIF